MSTSTERAEAHAVLAAYATTSAAQLRQLLPAMHPGIARRVTRIAAQLEASAGGLPENTPDPRAQTTRQNADTARSVHCPTCSADAGRYCTGSQGRQLRSVHLARVEAARSDETSDR